MNESNKPPMKIQNIPKEQYQGYLWYSDAEMPEIIDNNFDQVAQLTKIPFVIEGNLYCASKRLSIQIKHIDGDYWITQVILPEVDNQQYYEETYLAHDIPDYHKFRMLEAWEPQADELLAGMEALEPAWSAFAGFVK